MALAVLILQHATLNRRTRPRSAREFALRFFCSGPHVIYHDELATRPSNNAHARPHSFSVPGRSRLPGFCHVRADPRFRVPTGMTACTPTWSAIPAETTDRSPPTPATEDTAAASVSEQPQKAPPTAAPTTTTRRLLTTRRQGGGREARRHPDAQHGLARYASSQRSLRSRHLLRS